MGDKALKTRDQIDSKYKWNIEAMFPDETQIEADMAAETWAITVWHRSVIA